MSPRPALLLAALALTACDRLPTGKQAAYQPQEAGTIDQAMCLLGFSAVPLRTLATGHHLVDGTLNGRPATFVLDTGANVSVVHAPAAAEFGLGKGRGLPGAAIGLGGAMKATQVAMESLKLGNVPIRQTRIMTSDLSQITRVLGRMSPKPIHGIIGQDVMKEHRAVIDVPAPLLYLMAEDRDPAPVPLERCTGGAGEGKAPPKAKTSSPLALASPPV
jgi:hypothetical protein